MISFFDDDAFRQVAQDQGVALPDIPIDASLESLPGYQAALKTLSPHIAAMKERATSMTGVLTRSERDTYYALLEAQERVEYLANIVAFATNTGQLEDLQDKLLYLEEYGNPQTRAELSKDFAPYSFNFLMLKKHPETGEYKTWFNGGLIYHGPHDNGGDGSAPTFSVNLSPHDGWSIHT